MNLIRRIWRDSWPLICVITMVCMTILTGLLIGCNQSPTAQPATPTPDPKDTPTPLPLINSSTTANGTLPDGAIRIDNVVGIKMEASDSEWGQMQLIVLLEDINNTAGLNRVIVLWAPTEKITVSPGLGTDQKSFVRFVRDSGRRCDIGGCSASELNITIHSLAELH